MPPWIVEWSAFGVLAAALIASAVTDVARGRIYNVVTYPAIAIGLVGHTFIGGLAGNAASPGLAGAAAGLAAGCGPMLLVWLAGGIGGGDVKLMSAVGALAGWRFVLASMFCGFIVAAMLAAFIMIRRRLVRRTMGRVFRFAFVVFTANKPGDPATADSPRVPFGLALCIGAGLAFADLYFGGPLGGGLFGM